MSTTEYSVHMHDNEVGARADRLSSFSTVTVRLRIVEKVSREEHHILLFIEEERIWELSCLFTDLGQSLAALAPNEKTPPPIEVREKEKA